MSAAGWIFLTLWLLSVGVGIGGYMYAASVNRRLRACLVETKRALAVARAELATGHIAAVARQPLPEQDDPEAEDIKRRIEAADDRIAALIRRLPK